MASRSNTGSCNGVKIVCDLTVSAARAAAKLRWALSIAPSIPSITSRSQKGATLSLPRAWLPGLRLKAPAISYCVLR